MKMTIKSSNHENNCLVINCLFVFYVVKSIKHIHKAPITITGRLKDKSTKRKVIKIQSKITATITDVL